MTQDSKNKLKSILNSLDSKKSKSKSSKPNEPDLDEISTQMSLDDVLALLQTLSKKKSSKTTSLFVVPTDSELYKSTHYFKCFEKTPRYPPLDKAVKELASLFESIDREDIVEIINHYYRTYGSEYQAKCVTMIWTTIGDIKDLINCALVVDAVHVYEYDEKKYHYYFDQLDKTELYYKQVITKSIKFIRILNSCLVDQGTLFNDENRITYRGIHKCILQDAEEGHTFRVINWMCTSESLDKAQYLSQEHGDDKVIVQCNIPAGCFNAGKINKFGKSKYPDEKETLMPPYTVVSLKSKEDDYIVVDVARDNKDYNFGMAAVTS